MIENDFFDKKSIHYKSKSGSLYYYSDKGVYRYSNHWGRVANCRWKIGGIENYKNHNYYVGYANWSDFFPLNSSEKLFYLKYNSSTSQVTVHRSLRSENTSHFLMTLELALKRLKEIKSLHKNYKWTLYYNNPQEVCNQLISKLIVSDKPIQILKQSLNKMAV